MEASLPTRRDPQIRRRVVLLALPNGSIVWPSFLTNKRVNPALTPTIKCPQGPRQLALVVSKKHNWTSHSPTKDFFVRAVFNAIADVYQDQEAFDNILTTGGMPPNKLAASKRMDEVLQFFKHGQEADDATIMQAFVDLFVAISIYLADTK